MRTVRALSRLPSRERTLLLAVLPHSSTTRVCAGRLEAYPRPARQAIRRERSLFPVVRSCAVAAPQRHHTIQKGELGYRTDFAEQFSLLEVIGKGNFGTVWLAASRHDPSQQLAVKVVPKTRNDRTHEECLHCIKREVAMWGSLSGDSRFVAQLLGLYEDSSSVYLVQQLCQGGDLGSVLKDAPLPEACCAAIMWCVLSAIRDCHAHSLALIDVKPQNFLLTRPPASGAGVGAGTGGAGGCHVSQLRLSDQVAVAGDGSAGPCVVACDFGCSLSYSDLMRGVKRAGSPVFFAPEQFTSSYSLGVDVWAAGVMLYLLLTGRYPFWDCKRDDLETRLPAYQVMLAVCSAPISFSGPEWSGLTREARDLVSVMLDRNPTTRVTAQQALQHPWFARWMRHEAAAAAAAAPAGSTGSGSKGAAASRRAKRMQQQQQLLQRKLQQQQAGKCAGGGAGKNAAGGAGQVCCGRMASASAAGLSAGRACCGGGSNILPLPSVSPFANTAAADLRDAASPELACASTHVATAGFSDASGDETSGASGGDSSATACTDDELFASPALAFEDYGCLSE